MKETPVLFGGDSSLVGIVTTPSEEGRMAPVACLMLNMGATHRVGPHRANVKLARHMSSEYGISSIRFDLAGLGDSGAPASANHYMTQVVFDMQAAMNLIETMLGIRRFIVIGLCSGSTNGMAAAMVDPRIVGILMFDSYAFPTRRAQLELTLRRAMAAPTNPAVIAKSIRWLHRKFSAKAAAAAAPVNFMRAVSREETEATFHRSMTELVGRGVALFFLYTGTKHVRDRGRDQLGRFASEPYAQHIDYQFIAEIDHSITTLASQHTFQAVVSEWVLRVVAGRTPAQQHRAAGSKPVTVNAPLQASVTPRLLGPVGSH
ncbi:alpha/beta fold hydrolase [Variovorax sp. dw_954]|uniref:alpha/beta fold hydrolase n=1 Tax=Variovorax sp. dw_954 TaxID=2720078 RepID=UPI001BD5C49A|nr:alpha/beta fold hydrolase [Variovorax sp. dw_954]